MKNQLRIHGYTHGYGYKNGEWSQIINVIAAVTAPGATVITAVINAIVAPVISTIVINFDKILEDIPVLYLLNWS